MQRESPCFNCLQSAINRPDDVISIISFLGRDSMARAWVLLLAVLAVVSVVSAEDYYATLGVQRSADEAAIKKAYRKLSMKFQ
ncbi:MAG: DnaJ domain-containing protein [Promethearchaeia archaeon]